ncbi:uncharacterized protein PHACADRAFT_83680 [Phanerochaete carnosa HHB-10118-sp]|uniref:Thioredoxin domain-containing protein n=1 Tax=Phanerochaete carnosa (strain HHB-10118-sp) TaxID=650164 RepID=K5WCH4_PHACS|nr:uncharacterized protein PHACADRAFT_83680 [Phanerochaete carnosa HHB-10118-sp]EKM61668.1 hypothetical protein PHACADRAFT_83680 [Phanerochaete carnosa HHB-10118-sp]
MPIHYTVDPATPDVLEGVTEDFILFYSSRDEHGKLWCPDCVDVEEIVSKTFESAEAPSVLIVWVGQRAQWKTPSNPFRAEPWKVGSIPTIIRVKDVSVSIRLGVISSVVD